MILRLVLATCLALGAAPAYAQNLLANGSFESGTLAGWSAGGATASQAYAHGGSWSARTANGMMEADVATVPGMPYKITLWARITSETGSDWGGFVTEAVSWSWTSLASSGPLTRVEIGSEWTKLAVSFAATTTTTRIRVGYFGGSGRQMVIHVDDVAVFAKGAVNQLPVVNATLDPTVITSIPQSQAWAVTGDDPDGAIVRVDWDFGDGSRSQSFSGSRPVLVPGSTVATVRIADDDGGVVTRSIAWSAAGSGFPSVSIDSPASDPLEVSSPAIALSGTAAGTVVRWSTDRGGAGDASGVGAWSATVPLLPGRNRILIQSHDGAGRVATASRTVRYVPAAALAVGTVSGLAGTHPVWDVLELGFTLDGSAATHPQFPYEAARPPGLEWVDGTSVEAEFSRDNWATVLRRAAFPNQPYQRALKGGEEWMVPSGAPGWCVRFAPTTPGAWKCRIRVTEARGEAVSPEYAFAAVSPSDPRNHGPVRVAPHDGRYFVYADGTAFPGCGHGIGFGAERFSYDAADAFDAMGDGNEDFLRWWIAGQLWGSAWQPWSSRTLSYDGTVPATGLSLESAWGDGFASLRLDAANPIMFQGFQSGHAGLLPGHTYRVRVRWRTEGVTGPAAAGAPWGACVKLTGWPEPGQTGAIPALVAHVNGTTPWHVATGTFTATTDLLPNLALVLENATGGRAFVDECALEEVLAPGSYGPQLLRGPSFMSLYAFDARRGAGMDHVLADAAARGVTFKLVIEEKQEFLLNHLGPDGLPDAVGGRFNAGPNTAVRRLHEYYWRHLFARLGAYRSVHSWELVNEEAPGPGAHFLLAADLAQRAAADGNPHPATTSTWATLAESAWNDPANTALGYADFHAYVRGTGWIEPKDSLAYDSAALMEAYDGAAAAAGFGKPVVWGEMGIDGTSGTDGEDPLVAQDAGGVWLHKIVWARCGPGGVYPLYWYTDNIFAKDLHHLYGNWRRFMDGVPLANGRFVTAAAVTSEPRMRVVGQKDLTAGFAYLWIDNAWSTWRRTVQGAITPALGGTLSVNLGRPGAVFDVRWYDTHTGSVTSTTTATADGSGNVSLAIANLTGDVAVQVGHAVVTAAGPPADAPLTQPELRSVGPSPFTRTTTVSFALPAATRARVCVLDVGGRTVATLLDGGAEAGPHMLVWNGAGRAPGMYFVHLEAAGRVVTRKVVLVH